MPLITFFIGVMFFVIPLKGYNQPARVFQDIWVDTKDSTTGYRIKGNSIEQVSKYITWDNEAGQPYYFLDSAFVSTAIAYQNIGSRVTYYDASDAPRSDLTYVIFNIQLLDPDHIQIRMSNWHQFSNSQDKEVLVSYRKKVIKDFTTDNKYFQTVQLKRIDHQ
jgi:hypothetical protein